MLMVLHKNGVTKSFEIRQLLTSRVKYTKDCAYFLLLLGKLCTI